MTDLGTFGGISSHAAAINSAGSIVGSADTAGGEEHAFSYDLATSTMTDLGTLGGTSPQQRIADDGSMVGYAADHGGGPQQVQVRPGDVEDEGCWARWVAGRVRKAPGRTRVHTIVGTSLVANGASQASGDLPAVDDHLGHVDPSPTTTLPASQPPAPAANPVETTPTYTG